MRITGSRPVSIVHGSKAGMRSLINPLHQGGDFLRLGELVLQFFRQRPGVFVGRNAYGLCGGVQGVFDYCTILLLAHDDADGRVFVLLTDQPYLRVMRM